jgi:hypothetical protein
MEIKKGHFFIGNRCNSKEESPKAEPKGFSCAY